MNDVSHQFMKQAMATSKGSGKILATLVGGRCTILPNGAIIDLSLQPNDNYKLT
jgi:hypothetical protein